MTRDAATEAQIIAADPARSTWLSANAGSGKTRVLTNRVARLLLEDVPPERILCLTYTKAAASEMQNRLFRQLGTWAMMEDTSLSEDLEGLGLDRCHLAPPLLSRARTLFARAIETPGGLKIQTIHAFCGRVLRQFPLEAGVPPGFKEIDERAQLLLAADVLDRLAEGQEGQDAGAVEAVAAHLGGSDLDGLVGAVLSARDAFDPAATADDIRRLFGVPKGETAKAILTDTFTGAEQGLAKALLPLLDPESRNLGKSHRILSAFPWDRPDLEALALIETVFLFAPTAKHHPDAAKIGSFGNKGIRTALGDALPPLEDFMNKLAAARPRRRALQAADRTAALHRFAAAFLPAYDQAKQVRGWLDFDDLIRRTWKMLQAPGRSQWVLFRLDGGIDHILVDEAQDTAPAQWRIIAKLAEEFTTEQGARGDVPRTIFVVGDKKQSIYSFQGADPSGFDRMGGHFKDRLGQINAPFQSRELIYSFRSAAPILRLVDQVAQGAAAPGLGENVQHKAFRGNLPGRVDIWPAIPKTPGQTPAEWHDPVDTPAEEHHHVQLARRVAEEIKGMLDGSTAIEVEKGGTRVRRAVRAGDILILLQRRSRLFYHIISAIKTAGLPIAGADRMQLATELAVKDLIALMAFLATPGDDMSLAAVLRSPILDWDEADWDEAALFELAHGRDGSLWQALRKRGAEGSRTLAILNDLRKQADFMRPYDLLERVLIRHDARRRFLARLGDEAEDGLDAMLAQALAYERMQVPSLTGFVGWLQADDVTIKRRPGQAGDQIRVMSIHGAKGLEAPVVILPDCAKRGRAGPAGGVQVLTPKGSPAIWKQGKKEDAPPALRRAIEAADQAEAEERNRLLYVAMTRAANWLIVAAAGDVGNESCESWYGMIRDAAQDLGAVSVPMAGGEGLRLESGEWFAPGKAVPGTDVAQGAEPDPQQDITLPDWASGSPPPLHHLDPIRSPSDLGGAKALPGDGAEQDEATARTRGRRLHLLLEHLPALPRAAWRDAAPGILAQEADAPYPAEAEEELLAEAAAVLTAPALAHIFAPEALAEVPLTARSELTGTQLFGIIDRLIVAEDRVLAVDFKSNARIPDRPESVPEGLLRQMGAYAEMLAELYPDRQIKTAILWTRTAQLMPLPPDLILAALHRAAA
ncbi:MAG: double-strand break repair helicase AddA [Rhodobacteraceae bacterium]|nr:double-strand break repair helicase AddA [Paracoccaceae bacterium]